MRRNLADKIEAMKKLSVKELSEKFNCQPDEICFDDYIARYTDDIICPYKVIFGFANFENSQVEDMGNLEIVYGKRLADTHGDITNLNYKPVYLGMNLKKSKIKSLGKLRKVYGTIAFNSQITSLDNLEFLGSSLYLNNTNIIDLGKLKQIAGKLHLEDTNVCLESLKNLEKVDTIYINDNHLKDLGNLNSVKKIFYGKRCKSSTIQLFNSKMEEIQETLEQKNKD